MVTWAQAVCGGYLLGMVITTVHLVPAMWEDDPETLELGDCVAMALLVIIWPLALGLVTWDAIQVIRDRVNHARRKAATRGPRTPPHDGPDPRD